MQLIVKNTLKVRKGLTEATQSMIDIFTSTHIGFLEASFFGKAYIFDQAL
jgi:hypothetical protein